MSDYLPYKTVGQDDPKGHPWILYSSHPIDFEKYFDTVWKWLSGFQSIALFYEPDGMIIPPEQLKAYIRNMQMIVIPVTTRLLQDDCRTINEILPFANEEHIPVLPLMMERGLEEAFEQRFGNIQFLDAYSKDPTAIPFERKLEHYLKTNLISDELMKKIRAAFDAYIFLSYRKKDREYANELMRLIHKDKTCRDIAIWYDEYLVPGEDYNDAISKALKMSDIFALVVTPNLLEKPDGVPNYVMQHEYPDAVDAGKPILPVEMVKTDRSDLEAAYGRIPKSILKSSKDEITRRINEYLQIAVGEDSPEHNFFIGLAYLDGIDVEANHERAVDLITGSAENGLEEAMRKLADMYAAGKGVRRDYDQSLTWRIRLVDAIRNRYGNGSCDALILIRELRELGDAYSSLGMLEQARDTYQEFHGLAKQNSCKRNEGQRLYFESLSKLGEIYHLLGMPEEAERWYRESLKAYSSYAKTDVHSDKTLWILYNKLGDVLMSRNKRQDGAEMYQKALEEISTLASRKTSLDIRRSQAISYRKIFDLERALEITSAIADETGTIEDRRELSVLYNTAGAQMLRELPSFGTRKDCFEKAFEIRKALAEETGSFQAFRDLARIYENLGEEERKEANDFGNDYKKAEEMYRAAVDIRRDLAGKLNSDKDRFELARSLIFPGILGCERCLREAGEICGSLIKKHPDDRRYRMLEMQIDDLKHNASANDFRLHRYKYCIDY